MKKNREIKFETLKKSHKKQIVIGALAVCAIGGILTFKTSKAKYRVTEDIPLINGTINYTPYDFKIMAMYKSDDGKNYSEITTMPSSGYMINTSKSYCTTDNVNHSTNIALYTDGTGNHIFSNLKKSDKCYIWFDKKNYFTVNEIINNLTVNTTTPDFSKNATTDEGIYLADDPMYGNGARTYYWRGATSNNYLKFANKCWRIIRINGDRSIRIIYDGTTCHANGETGQTNTDSTAVANQAYHTSWNNSSYAGWTYEVGKQRTLGGTASNAKTQTEKWYNNNIGNNATYASKVADGKYCNDRRTKNNEAWKAEGELQYYAAYQRARETYQPTLSCEAGDIYTLKAGAITVDEVMYAGKGEPDNRSFYLYNKRYYWTMSPYNCYYDGQTTAHVFYVNETGWLGSNFGVYWTNVGLRPVINLKSTTTFSSGNGTINSPYIVS